MHKILGPGNQYVTAAKMALQNSEAMISMDMPAGPSEVLVIADAAASPAHVAADLLSQAEHGPDSQVGHLHLCTSCWLASRCTGTGSLTTQLQATQEWVPFVEYDAHCSASYQFGNQEVMRNTPGIDGQ